MTFFDSKINPVTKVHRNLEIGSPNDKYEKQADAVANRTVAMPNTTDALQMQSHLVSPDISMMCAECENEKGIQMQPNEEEEIRMKPEEEEKIQMKPLIQTEANGTMHASSDFANSLQSQNGLGRPLPGSINNEMGSKMGSDFSKVKIHTDNQAVQMNQEIGAQAFTNGDHIYFDKGKYAPGSAAGKHLLVHELVHVVQQNGAKKSIQRKLTVEDDYPQAYVDFILKKPKGKDKSKDLSNTERLSYVTVLLGKLSPHFKVGVGGQVIPSGDKKEKDLAKDAKATASCCLHVFTRKASTTDWKILVADHLAPHTFEKKASVLINSEISPVGFGHHTATGAKHMYDKGQVILGHELCGHASLLELGAHPEGPRAVTNVHDPTINIENEIAKEQGEKKKNLRGFSKSGFHRGESFGQMVIEKFKLNLGSVFGLPASEQNKMRMLADMIRVHDLFVELHGHSDNAGSEAAKQEVSDRRALQAKRFLMNMGVSLFADVTISDDTDVPGVPVQRFVLKGLSDKEPPAGVDPAQQDRFRRVEVTVASFPWALSELPSGISKDQLKKLELRDKDKDTFAKPGKVEKLRDKGTPCEKLLIDKAY